MSEDSALLTVPRPGANWQLPFQRLDLLLEKAVAAAHLAFGPQARHDSFRGLYVTHEQVSEAFGRPAGDPFGGPRARPWPDLIEPGWPQIAEAHEGWRWLIRTAGLSPAELDVVLIALGPEADLRYERVYGYLQDDVGRRRPTVNLVLDLISAVAQQKLEQRALFAADAPLLRRTLIRLADDDRGLTPLLARLVVLDDQVIDLLLAPGGLDRQLSACCDITAPARLPPDHVVPPAARETLLRAAQNLAAGRALRVQLHGPDRAAAQASATLLASVLEQPLLTLRTTHLPDDDREGAAILARAFRAAALRGALLFIDGSDALTPGSGQREALLEGLSEHPYGTVLSGRRAWVAEGAVPLGVLDVLLEPLESSVRQAVWAESLSRAGFAQSAVLARTLADRFSFGPARIADAVASAVAVTGPSERPQATQVLAAARRQTSHRLDALARRIEPAVTWDDLALPPGTRAQLEELCARLRHRSTVLHQWGFGAKLTRGRGTSALFTGPPGTGKTTSAEVVAGELGLDLFAIDLSGVVSKYIGETEKNLEQIFVAAAETDAILLFDEADALFGKRSEVHDAHDRYANIETSYLLQRMEQFDGIAILATNLRANLDEAFTRRLQFAIDFPFPDEEQRERIWRICFPPSAPLAPGIDLASFARDFRLSGAGIRNVVLRAAYLAAAAETPIGRKPLLTAVRREFEKMGQLPPDPAGEG